MAFNKTFEYKKNGSSSGKIINIPVFAYPENTAGYPTFQNGYSFYVNPYNILNNINRDYYKYFLSFLSTPNWVLGTMERSDIEYSSIKEINSDSNGNNGSLITEFSIEDAKEMLNNNYLFTPYAFPWLNGYTYFPGANTIYREYNSTPDLRGLEFGRGTYPYLPYSQNYWERGLITKQSFFDNLGKTIKIVENFYEYLNNYPSFNILNCLNIQNQEIIELVLLM